MVKTKEMLWLQGKTRILIDAEATYMQPAIDALVIAMQQRYNRHTVVIMNTYQCYLKVDLHPLQQMEVVTKASILHDRTLPLSRFARHEVCATPECT